jgi:hypothetical protein
MTGLRGCRNTFVRKEGGISNMPGSGFSAPVKDSTKTVRLIPFVTASGRYVLEFGDSYVRFYKNRQQIREAGKTITAITNANPAVVTSAAHGFNNGDEVYLSGIGGMTELNGRWFIVANKAANTFELKYRDATNVDSTAFGVYTSAGTAERVYTITSNTIPEASLPYIKATFQSPASLVITVPGFSTRLLTRTSDTSWAISLLSFASTTIGTPVISGVTGTAGAVAVGYAVTAYDSQTGEESFPGIGSFTGAAASSGAPVTIQWAAIANATEYNIYKATTNGAFGLIGVSGPLASPQFTDTGQSPDYSTGYPTLKTWSGNWAACTFFQRRLVLAGNSSRPNRFIAAKTGLPTNHTYSDPIGASDVVDVFLDGSGKHHIIQDVLDLGNLIVFTSEGEWLIQGDAQGLLRPDAINPKEYSGWGSSYLSPVKIGNNALFVQASGNVVRDLGFEFQVDGYKGNDLTTFAGHLFKNKTIMDWAYQKSPHSIVWVVRDDGQALGLTYVKEHEIWAWHRHDTLGSYENFCTIQSSTGETDLYQCVVRTINGVDERYIEVKKSRDFADIVDAVFMDSTLTVDGRNQTGISMTISGGTTWDYEETLTITASAASFTAADVGNQIKITDFDGNIVIFTLNSYTSTTVMHGTVDRTVPVSIRSVAFLDWTRMVSQVTGLWHLEGEEVSVLGDGFVVGSPYNPAYPTYTVANGKITLDRPYGVIHVGLPYISDVESLNIDTANAETMSDKHMIVRSVHGQIEETRGLFVGPKPPSDDDVDPLEGLRPAISRSSEGYDEPINLTNESFEVTIPGEWNSNGRVFIRQVDPLPFTILSIKPQGDFPVRR